MKTAVEMEKFQGAGCGGNSCSRTLRYKMALVNHSLRAVSLFLEHDTLVRWTE